ncbi:hypothetical protein IWX65_003290 [Arthrobacter sp. CAN_A214]
MSSTAALNGESRNRRKIAKNNSQKQPSHCQCNMPIKAIPIASCRTTAVMTGSHCCVKRPTTVVLEERLNGRRNPSDEATNDLGFIPDRRRSKIADTIDVLREDSTTASNSSSPGSGAVSYARAVMVLDFVDAGLLPILLVAVTVKA